MFRIIGIVAVLLNLVIIPGVGGDKNTRADAAEIEKKFSQSWKETEASRRSYTWKAGTEVVREGKIIQQLIEKVTYTQDFKEIRQVISNKEEPLPSGILIRKIAEDQKAKIVSFMKELRSFLEKYSLSDDNKRRSFFLNADISGPDEKGHILISGTNVFAQGDKLKWWIDTKSYSLTNATISTNYKDVGALFSATYYLLPGMNYMAQATIRIPSKNIVVNLKFYDFVKTGS